MIARCFLASALVLAAHTHAAPSSEIPYHANLNEALAPFKAASSPRMLMLGDSLTFRDNGPYAFFRASIQAERGNAGDGWKSMSVWTGGGFDPGWTWGFVNADTFPYRSIDGLWASTSGAQWGRLDPIPGTKKMRFVINGNGDFAIWNTATNLTTRHTAPGIFDVDFPANAGRVWLQPSATGQVIVLGAWCTNNQPGATVSRGANGGWGVENFLHRDESFEQVGTLIAPDLIWITLGQNDAVRYTPAQYTPKMRALIQRVRAMAPGAGIVLVSSYDSGSKLIGDIAGAVYDAAIQEHVGFINLYRAGGPYSFFQEKAFLDDPVHFSAAGGMYVADILYQAMRSDGRSLHFCQGDTNQDGDTNGADLSVLLASYGERGLPWRHGDNNGDGTVDGADLSVLLSTFGCSR